ncbi:putative molybdenum carrier protein [Anatilimnocola floriformis]|uniref:putative molybdenum carrier protein n=1 Tax=Anatilimnocola floriformis TaxID=2948575 RepID=UPI0020C1DBF7|nr:putative molybdenum carrier protein [Anatilimnocola floriformis]
MAKAAKSKPSAAIETEAAPLLPHYVKMIVSGGQTGVDRAALEVAIELGIPHGGFCPKGRLAEDGPIATHFRLQETASADYWVRTEKNVDYADGTLILYRGKLTRGSSLTRKYAQRLRKTYRCVQLKPGSTAQLRNIRSWLCKQQILILNIAGPRESTSPGIGSETKAFLRLLFIRPKHTAPVAKKAKSKNAPAKLK